MQTPTTAGRGWWRGHPETSRGEALSFAVNSRPRPPRSLLGANSNHLVSTASAPSAALCSIGRASSVLRPLPCEGESGGHDSGPRRRRVRARGGSAVCMMASQKPSQQLRKAKPPPVSAGGVGVGVGAAAAAAAPAPAPALDNPREIIAAVYACEGRGRSWFCCMFLSVEVLRSTGPFLGDRVPASCHVVYVHRPARLHGRVNRPRCYLFAPVYALVASFPVPIFARSYVV